jgi:hypothetical protein
MTPPKRLRRFPHWGPRQWPGKAGSTAAAGISLWLGNWRRAGGSTGMETYEFKIE